MCHFGPGIYSGPTVDFLGLNKIYLDLKAIQIGELLQNQRVKRHCRRMELNRRCCIGDKAACSGESIVPSPPTPMMVALSRANERNVSGDKGKI